MADGKAQGTIDGNSRLMPYHQGYGDPLHELIGKENKTCKGCVHKSTEKAFGIEINFCKLGKKYMHRCEQYQEKNNAADHHQEAK